MSVPLKEFSGRVVEISPKYKAVLEFQLEGKTERALLWYNKLRINGELLPEGGNIDHYLKGGSQLTFLCHSFDPTGMDRCGWYVTSAWPHDGTTSALARFDTVQYGIHNRTGIIQEVSHRQGILSFISDGKEENVLFLASKIWLHGKRVKAKAKLYTLNGIEEGHSIMFDAVPCEPSETDGRYTWFATVVWKGRKPFMGYDDARRPQPQAKTPVAQIEQVMTNPHSVYLRTTGQVMSILSPELGIALARMSSNCWESVLFHRNNVIVVDINLSQIKTADLTKIFKEGDKLRIVGTVAPRKLCVRWVASQVRLDFIDPSMTDDFE